VRRLTILAGLLLALQASESRAQDAPASTAFPGSIWFSAGSVGPAERGNVLGQSGFEQGVTVWERSDWFLVPYLGATVLTDSAGYDWNNRHPWQVGLKLARRVPGGVVQAGGGMLFEVNPDSGRHHHGTLFVNYWAGWAAEGRAQHGSVLRGFPGHAYASSGLVSGRDPHNWITMAAAQQGVAILRSHIVTVVPYAGGSVSVDTRRRVWENRVTYDAGVKLVRPFTGGVIETGVAARRQHTVLTGQVESAPVAYVNVWVGWNPRTVR
jgi:hypothetical protein